MSFIVEGFHVQVFSITEIHYIIEDTGSDGAQDGNFCR
jgi:hypothetical protein